MIRSKSVRGFTVGATNALFVTKRDLVDVFITVDDQDCGQIDFQNGSVKKELILTSADLRFGDYLLKNIEENRRSRGMFEGNDEWLRMQMREYLLSMGASSRSDLTLAVGDYGVSFIHNWRLTRNYQIWMNGPHEDLSGIAPGHAFSGQLGVYDVLLRMEHAVGGSEGARKALSAISSTGRNIGETGNKVRHSVTNWFKGSATNAEEVTEEFTGTSEKMDDDDSSGQGNSQGPTLLMSAADREQISNKIRSSLTWFRGALRDDEMCGTAHDHPSSKNPMS